MKNEDRSFHFLLERMKRKKEGRGMVDERRKILRVYGGGVVVFMFGMMMLLLWLLISPDDGVEKYMIRGKCVINNINLMNVHRHDSRYAIETNFTFNGEQLIQYGKEYIHINEFRINRGLNHTMNCYHNLITDRYEFSRIPHSEINTIVNVIYIVSFGMITIIATFTIPILEHEINNGISMDNLIKSIGLVVSCIFAILLFASIIYVAKNDGYLSQINQFYTLNGNKYINGNCNITNYTIDDNLIILKGFFNNSIFINIPYNGDLSNLLDQPFVDHRIRCHKSIIHTDNGIKMHFDRHYMIVHNLNIYIYISSCLLILTSFSSIFWI